MKMAQEISLDQSTLKLLNHWAKNDNPIQDKHSEFRRMWNDAQYWKTLCTQRHSIRSWEEMRRIHFEPVFLSAADEWHGSDAVIFLLEQDINPNIQDASGRSALHKIISYAIFEAPNALNALKLLLQKGANTTLKDENGQTVFDELQKHTDSPVYQQIKSLLEENSQKAAAQQQVALPSLLAGPTVSSLLKSPLKQNSPPDEREKKFDSDDEPEGPAAASPLRHNVAAAKENDQPPEVIAAIKTIRDLFDEVALGNIQILENEKTKIMYFIFEEARKEMAGPVADAIEVLIPGTKAKKPGEKGMRVMPRDFSPNQDGTDLKISAGITSEQFTTLMDKCGSQTKLNFLIGKQNRYLTELGEIKDLNSLQAKEVRRKLEDIQEQMTEVADELQGRAPIVARENATRMSQHNRPTQIDENNKIVSQDLPKPYTIEYDIRSGWEFRLPKNAPDYHINPEELLAVLPKLTGMTPKHCGMLLQAIKADNEKRTDANVMKFFNDTMQADSRFAFRKKCPGVGEYLNGKEYCIESDERYLERSTKYIASLKKSIEGGADVLRLEKQFYGNGQDEKRKEIIQQALEANGLMRVIRMRKTFLSTGGYKTPQEWV
ncbi:MAG: hypothetical protein K0Q74_524 [Gammaproteobacteria bacterium]|nr:hypothetical protein [Gammaproteobacteria bacterium]